MSEAPSLKRYAMDVDHDTRTRRMLVETLGLFGSFAALATVGWLAGQPMMIGAAALLQGLWMQRLYVVGHEAAHRKLYPGQRLRNDLWGQLVLLPILVPLPVFVAIHRFHHGFNRRDPRTSALDTFVFSHVGPAQKAYAWAVWLAAVLAGGWFWHSVVSILLFLALPVRIARHVSPAFEGWSTRERLASIAAFSVALAVHAALVTIGGWSLWLAVIGAPLLVFGWVYSVQLYAYHYATTIGPEVTLHARRLHGPGISWWLLNLNEHDTHHRRPSMVWYGLPNGAPLPEDYRSNQNTSSFFTGLLQQLRGPTVLNADPTRHTE